MNRSLLAFASPLLVFVGCALDEQPGTDNPPATGGAAGAGTPTGGVAGSGVGGTPATGGTGTPTGGAAGSPLGGTAGAGVTGGSAGIGTGGDMGGAPPGGMGGLPPGGDGGSTMTGGAGGAGGAPPGGMGGAAPGGAGAGGAGAGGRGGSGGGALTPESVVPGLDGYTQTYPCDGGEVFTQYDCRNTMCASSARTVQRDFTVTGSASTTYELTIRVRGVVETKNYTGGTRRAGTGAMDSTVMGGDFLYTGGSAPNTTYNEYSLRVQAGAVTGQPTYYGLNARNGTNEDHESYALNFTMTLRVQGGGTVRYRMFDSNCRQITNCGADTGSGNCGSDQRILTFMGADPMPTGLAQPYLGAPTANGPGQWIFLDVTSVTVVP